MNRGIIAFGVGVLGSFCLPFTSVQAVTNSWIYTGSDFWDTQSRWSVTNFPTITDAADLIVNANTKTVTIDDNDALFVQSSLTISNLTVGGTGTSTNTLSLNNMTFGAAVPLHILNVMAITNGGVLQVTNSMLQVDSIFNLNGAMRVFNGASIQFQNAVIATNALTLFALGTNSTAVAVISNLTIGGTVSVTNGGGFAANTYTLFTYGGTLTNNGLAVGSAPSNFTYAVDTSTIGQVKLVVSAVSTGTPSSTLVITSIAQQGNDILISWTTSGAGTTNIVEVTSGTGDGSYSNNFTSLSGNITVTGTTTNYLDVGGATNSPSRFYRIRATGTGQAPLDSVGDGIPDSWRQQYFGSGTTTNANSCASCDPDGDGLSNLAEYLSGSNPTNSMSGLRIISTVQVNNDIVVTWSTAGGHTNILQATSGNAGGYSTNFVDILASKTIVGGIGDTTTNYTDAGGATNTPGYFYRVRLVP